MLQRAERRKRSSESARARRVRLCACRAPPRTRLRHIFLAQFFGGGGGGGACARSDVPTVESASPPRSTRKRTDDTRARRCAARDRVGRAKLSPATGGAHERRLCGGRGGLPPRARGRTRPGGCAREAGLGRLRRRRAARGGRAPGSVAVRAQAAARGVLPRRARERARPGAEPATDARGRPAGRGPPRPRAGGAPSAVRHLRFGGGGDASHG